MLSDYTNESITRKIKGTVNGANEATFTSATILGRLQHKVRMVRNAQGVLVQSNSQLFTETAVVLGDRIAVDGLEFPVIAVEPIKDLDGVVQWREVYL